MNASRTLRFLLAAAVLLAALLPTASLADDRDVLRDTQGRPYVFIVLDTSGSMNWSPRCTAQQVTDGICTYLCPNGDCATPRDGDDPASKFRQAKEALYEVLQNINDVDFGFATYNQDNLSVQNKHWLYRVSGSVSGFHSLAGGVQFPATNAQYVFGEILDTGNAVNLGCDRWNGGSCSDETNQPSGTTNPGPGGNDGCPNQDYRNWEVACYPSDAAVVTDTWEMTKERRFPKLGEAPGFATTVTTYVRSGSTTYRVRYIPVAGFVPPAADVRIDVEVRTCTGFSGTQTTCPTLGTATTRRILFSRAQGGNSDFLMWDNTVDRNSPQDGFLNARFTNAGNTCEGWEPNTDTNLSGDDGQDDDQPGGVYNLKQITVDDPATPDRPDPNRFDYGDVIPLDWLSDNKLAILNRLAPRLNGAAASTDPEAFANATYLANSQSGTETFLRLANTNQRMLIPNGSTPIGYTLQSFRQWYKGCVSGNCGSNGWDDVAAVADPKWACRQKYMIFLTDGDDTCDGSSTSGGNTCNMATQLFNDGVTQFVVGYGLENTTGNQLSCMAENGGTGEPIFPQNKQELIDALNSIFGRVREQAAAFASAAVPQVQANVSDKIFLSSFTPLNEAGFWAGRLDSFLKPLPLDDQKLPDRSVECSSTVQSECFLWDAGDVQDGHLGGDGTYDPERLLLQAPHPDDVTAAPPWDPTDLQLGTDADQRRVVYTQWSEAGNRRLLSYPSTNAQKYDLWDGFGISYIVGNTASETAATNDANATIVNTLLEKEGIVDIVDPDDPSQTLQLPITYLLGDIFHADPVILSRPSNYNLYATDPYKNAALCGAAADPSRTPPTSYRWFADRNFCRRAVLLAAANDGQLHAFDTGIFRNAGGGEYECLLPAKDLDNDGVAEANEFADGLIDYDLNDLVDGNKSCTSDAQCSSGPCAGGFCRDVKVGVIDGVYDNGSGREIFSFIPRQMLPTTHLAANGGDRNSEFWGIDAGIRVDDVFMDPLASETGTVACLDREWRTVGIGGYREGGPGYYALDLTQPDELDSSNVPDPDNGYVPSCFGGSSACQNRPYPAVLWEFLDRESVTIGGVPTITRLDEDLNGTVDLANSWSKATTGRIRVCTGSCTANDSSDLFVAVFGGGIGDNPTIAHGNYIYMVDIETGRTVYKERVVGAVPADIAAIDSNGDSYLDRLYFGTTAGFLYKVQFETNPANPMRLTSQTFQTRVAGTNYNFTSTRLQGPTGDLNKYDPFQVFSTGAKPIYLEASAIFVGQSSRIAVAFGTGNRWNLWDSSGVDGRFYTILDDNFADPNRDGVLDISCTGCTQPLTEASYTAVDPDAAFDPSSPIYYLYDGGGGNSLRGWYMDLGTDEKVITEAFSLAGVSIFTSFEPTASTNDDGTCSRAGESKIFIVGSVTALGYAIPPGGTLADRARFTRIPQFTTPPFVEQSATANPGTGGGGSGGSGGGGSHADFMTETLKLIRDELKTLQSTRCKYANYTQNIKTIRSDTGVVFVAPIPVCIDPTSWKEF
jgi:hypothetical protein